MYISMYNCLLSKGLYGTYHIEASLSYKNHFDEKVILIILFQLGSIHTCFGNINYVIGRPSLFRHRIIQSFQNPFGREYDYFIIHV